MLHFAGTPLGSRGLQPISLCMHPNTPPPQILNTFKGCPCRPKLATWHRVRQLSKHTTDVDWAGLRVTQRKTVTMTLGGPPTN